MMLMTFIWRTFMVLLLAGVAAGAHAAGPAPPASLYQSDVALTDQDGRVFHLVDLHGESMPVSMSYASCQTAYLMTFETTRVTLAKGGKPAHDGVWTLMAAVGPERGSVAALKKTVNAHGADDRWQVVRVSASDAREVAVLLGVQYRRLADGDLNHSSTILLLDVEGRINTRTNTLGAVDPKLVDVIRKLVVAQR